MQAPLWYTNLDDLNPETWGVDSHPPGGFLGFFKDASNVNSSQQIKEKDDSNGVECARTEKRLLWTKDEDLRLVGAWLNNSNDPIQSNYKKNDQYWKEVAAVYNSTTPKNRERLVKQVKGRFARIKKRW
ncbi:glutathione S-transferase T3-like [Hordeum vulgare subsp. vulgare]|uniref:glutathione S-transferase T3-like n=1 Tax=Hordeum vulgare subsp. vulgare TaxID=112509 RepID=UPI001D1A57E5|nr:glutathione S-transferase T3-like [Hordeum vulgare subsp. vulgare]